MKYLEGLIKELTQPVISEIPTSNQEEYGRKFEGNVGSEKILIDIVGRNIHNSNLESETNEILKLEKILCGHFNKFSASSEGGIDEKNNEIDKKISKGSTARNENQMGVTKKSNKSNEWKKDLLQMESEMEHVDEVVQTFDQILADFEIRNSDYKN
jgi:hypothetical protein